MAQVLPIRFQEHMQVTHHINKKKKFLFFLNFVVILVSVTAAVAANECLEKLCLLPCNDEKCK